MSDATRRYQPNSTNQSSGTQSARSFATSDGGMPSTSSSGLGDAAMARTSIAPSAGAAAGGSGSTLPQLGSAASETAGASTGASAGATGASAAGAASAGEAAAVAGGAETSTGVGAVVGVPTLIAAGAVIGAGKVSDLAQAAGSHATAAMDDVEGLG